MKSVTNENIRLMLAALGARDALRNLAVEVDQARTDPALQPSVLKKAYEICVRHADRLRLALKASPTRRRGHRAI